MKTLNGTTLNQSERQILAAIETRPGMKITSVDRRGARHFDLTVWGYQTKKYNGQACTSTFSAWLPELWQRGAK